MTLHKPSPDFRPARAFTPAPEPMLCQDAEGYVFHIVPYKGKCGWNAVIPSGNYAGCVFTAYTRESWDLQIEYYKKYEVQT